MSFLVADSIKPEERVLAPNIHAHPEEALAYWLSNPLLPAGRVTATKNLLASRYHSAGDKQAMAMRLKKHVKTARLALPLSSDGHQLLVKLLRHDLVTPSERNDHKPYVHELRGPEIEWEYARLEAAIQQRQYAANPHADAA